MCNKSRDICTDCIKNSRNDLFSLASFQITRSRFSDLDERWTDTTGNHLTFENRLYWLTYGRAAVIVDGVEISLEPGYLYLIPTNCILELKAEQKFGKYWCHFFSPVFNGFDLLEMVTTPIKLQVEHPEEIDRIFRHLVETTEQGPVGWVNIQRISLVIQLLLPFLSASEESSMQAKRKHFLPVLQYIQEHIDQTIKLKQLASVMHLSPFYFARKFSEYFHCSPIDYVIIKRIQLAQRMLAVGSTPLNEIAQQCGFNSISYFSKTFHRLTNRSPSQFRAIFRTKIEMPEEAQKRLVPGGMYASDSIFSQRLVRSWLRSELDCQYCNVQYVTRDTGLSVDLDYDWQQPEQKTAFNTLYAPASGFGLISVNRIDFTLRQGELYLVPCGSRLAIKGGHHLDLFHCHFSAKQTAGNDLFESMKVPTRLVPADSKRINTLFRQLEDSMTKNEEAWQIPERTFLLLELLIPFLQVAEEQPRDYAAFLPVMRFIKEQLHRSVTLTELATVNGQSPEHFARSFRETLNMPPMHYVTAERIRRAKKLLTNTAITAENIGRQCGFNTPSNFAKTFKKLTGKTPGQFRKQTKSSNQ